MAYDFQSVESKWQRRWEKSATFSDTNKSDKPKFYCFEYPPYPSGSLHVGHVRNYTIGDVIARFKRMQGYNVLYTQGFDSFGLPNEIAAIENNIHPEIWTQKCIQDIKKQFINLGYSYDSNRFVTYHDEDYYKWTQWLFLLFLKHGLAYKKQASVNWCKTCETVLADDQAVEGRCWRCDEPVQTKYLNQWFLAIRKYTDKLLSGLDELDGWPEGIKAVQRNWFGRSEGVEVFFHVPAVSEDLPVFTTTPELIYGATFVAISPSHPLIAKLVRQGKIPEDIIASIETLKQATKAPEARKNYLTEGISLNLVARNPLNGRNCPIYVANYVESNYGTGAIFCVPAHDKADFEFARRHNISQISVLHSFVSSRFGQRNYTLPGEKDSLINSGRFSGLRTEVAKEEVTKHILSQKLGRKAVHYRVRDWLISRQRYWGPPIPVIYCDNCGMVPVPEDKLPVKLPKNIDFKRPGNPLNRSQEFVQCRCYRCNGPAKRETDTMDTFVNSSWFYLRYCSPTYQQFMFDRAEVNYWMPANVAIGGVEHATTVYIHDRFVTKVLNDVGLLAFNEPFLNLLAHELVVKDGKKMSKSIGNIVDPSEVIKKYGADTLRMAILFIAPPERKLEWKETMLKSCYRFLNSVWELVAANIEGIKTYADHRLGSDKISSQEALSKEINRIVGKITLDLEQYHFNTCIHFLFELARLLGDFRKKRLASSLDKSDWTVFFKGIQTLLVLLSPFAPHISEELWEKLDLKDMASQADWPRYDEELARSKTRTLVIQINGKTELELKALPERMTRVEIEDIVFNQALVIQKLRGKNIRKKIFVEEPTFILFNVVV